MSTTNRLLPSIFVPRRSGALVRRYGIATGLVTAALAAAFVLRVYGLPHPFLSFSFAGIAIAFWYAGTGPGLLAVVLSYSALTYWLFAAELRESTVIRLLTAFERTVPILAVRPASRRLSTKVRIFIEHLEKTWALCSQFNPRPS